MFDKTRKLGILRLDLCSAYAKQASIFEQLKLSIENFCEAFGIQQIAIKAISAATERIAALQGCDFTLTERNINGQHGDYYLR